MAIELNEVSGADITEAGNWRLFTFWTKTGPDPQDVAAFQQLMGRPLDAVLDALDSMGVNVADRARWQLSTHVPGGQLFTAAGAHTLGLVAVNDVDNTVSLTLLKDPN